MMIETFSMLSGSAVLSAIGRFLLGQMQPRGLGMPAILAAILAGPLGKSW